MNLRRGVRPTHESPIPDWDGRHPDYPHIIDIVLDTDGRLGDHSPSSNQLGANEAKATVDEVGDASDPTIRLSEPR